MNSVLLVDDDNDSTSSLMRALLGVGLQASMYRSSSAHEAVDLQQLHAPSVIVLDLVLDESVGVESGMTLLKRFLRYDSSCRIIVLTGHGGSEHGIRALRAGAANFLEKPASVEHLRAIIEDGQKQAELRREMQLFKDQGRTAKRYFLGESSLAKGVQEALTYAAQTNQAVLILGETGTGKTLCARAIHQLSSRRESPFVRYQPSFSSGDMVGSELFGHMKGAFTGADKSRSGLLDEVEGGTFFLDEVGELSHAAQVALLGVLQEKLYRPVGSNHERRSNFRLICASNRDMEAAVQEGEVRRDFFHRTAHFVVKIPPLRERKEDLAELVPALLARVCEREGLTILSCGDEAIGELRAHDWPGNVRELETVLEGAAYSAQLGGRIRILPMDLRLHAQSGSKYGELTSFRERIEEYKWKLVHEALLQNDGNQVQAAAQLSMDRSTLRRIAQRNL